MFSHDAAQLKQPLCRVSLGSIHMDSVIGEKYFKDTVLYVVSCRNFWLQYRNIQDGGPNKHENVSSF